MTPEFTCGDDFVKSAREVDMLLQLAEANLTPPEKYSVFNKVGLLLLAAKFETFLEASVESFVYNLELLRLPPERLPEHIKVRSACFILDDAFVECLRALKPSVLETLRGVFPLLSASQGIREIPFDSKFTYGRHGSKEIVKLFKRIGIEDIFESCPVMERVDVADSVTPGPQSVNLVADINSMTNYRNLIMHEDQSPALTHQQIEAYKRHLLSFAGAIVAKLQQDFAKLADAG